MVITYIIIAIALIGVGFCGGGIFECARSLKDLDDIQKNVDEVYAAYQDTIELGDKIIENYRGLCQKKDQLISLYKQDLAFVYDRLVILRDKDGVEGLDELIGHLGSVLDDSHDSKKEAANE